MRIGDKDVSKWTMLMLIGSILMFASFFLSLVGVEVLGKGFAISGLELLSGFDIGIKEIGANKLLLFALTDTTQARPTSLSQSRSATVSASKNKTARTSSSVYKSR